MKDPEIDPNRTLDDGSGGTVDGSDDLEPIEGELIDGTHRVLARLGSGTMGTVYRALDEQLDREIAIKLLRGRQFATHESIQLLRAEARALARVRHPNVVEVHAFGVHRAQPYLAMELIRGPDLGRWQQEHAPVGLDAVIDLLSQLACGVEAIHAAGEVHRDIKPSNIVVGPQNRVVVTDFGLAKVRGQFDPYASATIAGTPAYIAPEIAQRLPLVEELLPRIDVYSLGLIAFELLAGRRPFDATNAWRLIEQHARHVPPRVSAVNPEVSSRFDRPIAMALAKDPARRTPSAATFRDALIEAHRGVSPAAKRMRILVADDNASVLQATVVLLEDAFPGATVVSARDGNAALAMATRARPDVIITDLDMPGGGGRALIAAVRSQGMSQVPIVVVTGNSSSDEWRTLRRLGADRFLVKPVDVDVLISTVRSVVEPRPDGVRLVG